MSLSGQELREYNEQIVKCINQLREQRNELAFLIDKQQEEKSRLQTEIERITYKLSLIAKSLAQRMKTKQSYDRTLKEIEENYWRLVANGGCLLQCVQKEVSQLEELMDKRTSTDEALVGVLGTGQCKPGCREDFSQRSDKKETIKQQVPVQQYQSSRSSDYAPPKQREYKCPPEPLTLHPSDPPARTSETAARSSDPGSKGKNSSIHSRDSSLVSTGKKSNYTEEEKVSSASSKSRGSESRPKKSDSGEKPTTGDEDEEEEKEPTRQPKSSLSSPEKRTEKKSSKEHDVDVYKEGYQSQHNNDK